MTRGATIGTILTVIAAVVIAWLLVEFVLHLAFFVLKLVIVAVVALIVFVVLRMLLARRRAD